MSGCDCAPTKLFTKPGSSLDLARVLLLANHGSKLSMETKMFKDDSRKQLGISNEMSQAKSHFLFMPACMNQKWDMIEKGRRGK